MPSLCVCSSEVSHEDGVEENFFLFLISSVVFCKARRIYAGLARSNAPAGLREAAGMYVLVELCFLQQPPITLASLCLRALLVVLN